MKPFCLSMNTLSFLFQMQRPAQPIPTNVVSSTAVAVILLYKRVKDTVIEWCLVFLSEERVPGNKRL